MYVTIERARVIETPEKHWQCLFAPCGARSFLVRISRAQPHRQRGCDPLTVNQGDCIVEYEVVATSLHRSKRRRSLRALYSIALRLTHGTTRSPSGREASGSNELSDLIRDEPIPRTLKRCTRLNFAQPTIVAVGAGLEPASRALCPPKDLHLQSYG